MRKIVFIFLCFFIVVVFGSSDQNSNSDSTKNEIPSDLLKKMKELQKFHEEFKLFKLSFLELSAAFGHFHQSLTKIGTGETGKTGDVRSTTPSTPQELETPAFKSISSCSDSIEILPAPRSKKQTIYPHGNTSSGSLEVLCDFETDGGGWTIIQKRSSGPAREFNRNWAEYESGFGSLDKNFWIGLENIHALTQNGDQELRIQLEDFEGNKKWAKYSNFSVSGASDFYRLSIGGFHRNSTAGNDMMHHSDPKKVPNGMQFSTSDKDHDQHIWINCASFYLSGWWYNECGEVNLNGVYREKGEETPLHIGILWPSWKGTKYSLAKTEMKIRTRK